MSVKIKFLFGCLLCLGFIIPVHAQTKSKEKITKPVKSFRPPPLLTMLADHADTFNLAGAEIQRIIGLPLKVTDAKKAVYIITSYQFVYKRIVVSETEDGRAIPGSSISAQSFKVSPLPDAWVNLVREDLKKGEELLFFDIIVKDPQGRIMYAPNLKIFVQ